MIFGADISFRAQLRGALRLAQARSGGEDSDGDGHSNLSEYLAGTDPNSATSNFSLNISGSVSAVVVSFTALQAAGPGYEGLKRVYKLEQSDSLAAPNWSAVPGYENILGQNQTVSRTEPVPTYNAQRFYRARTVLSQ